MRKGICFGINLETGYDRSAIVALSTALFHRNPHETLTYKMETKDRDSNSIKPRNGLVYIGEPL